MKLYVVQIGLEQDWMGPEKGVWKTRINITRQTSGQIKYWIGAAVQNKEDHGEGPTKREVMLKIENTKRSVWVTSSDDGTNGNWWYVILHDLNDLGEIKITEGDEEPTLTGLEDAVQGLN